MTEYTGISQLLDVLIRIDKRLQSIESSLADSSSNTTVEKPITKEFENIVDLKRTTPLPDVEFVHGVIEEEVTNHQKVLCFFDDAVY